MEFVITHKRTIVEFTGEDRKIYKIILIREDKLKASLYIDQKLVSRATLDERQGYDAEDFAEDVIEEYLNRTK